MLNEENEWVKASPEDERDIAMSPQGKQFLEFNLTNYNEIVGFVGYEKGNNDLAFKTKNMSAKRDTGARCEQAAKKKNIVYLNQILGENKYTNETTKAVKVNGKTISESIGNTELCVTIEFILRYFNEINHQHKL